MLGSRTGKTIFSGGGREVGELEGWSKVCHLDTHSVEGSWPPPECLQQEHGSSGPVLDCNPPARLHNPAFGLSVEKYAVELQGAPLCWGAD